MKNRKEKVLFLCTHNSARSQIAEGIINNFYADKYQGYSAGIQPSFVSPYAIEALRELRIDISNHRSKGIDEFKGNKFDYVVTVCDNVKELCPFFPGGNLIHISFKDPGVIDGSIEDIMNGFRKIRNEIKDWIIKTFGYP